MFSENRPSVRQSPVHRTSARPSDPDSMTTAENRAIQVSPPGPAATSPGWVLHHSPIAKSVSEEQTDGSRKSCILDDEQNGAHPSPATRRPTRWNQTAATQNYVPRG